jgi:cysteine-rich repeat protein
VGTGETCDDGNTANGDGCSATCAIEPCSSMDFTAGGNATVASAPSLDVGTSWSVAFWARPATATSNGAIWTNEVSGSRCGTLVIGHYLPGGLRFGSTVGGCGTSRVDISTNYRMPAGVWTHIAVVVSGTLATTYVNGAVLRSDTVPSVDPGLTSDPFRIATDGVFGFPGNIADLGMWSRALGAAEVATLRSVGFRGLPADPALRVAIRGSEGMGTVANDASGNGNRANFVGAAGWSMSCPARP